MARVKASALADGSDLLGFSTCWRYQLELYLPPIDRGWEKPLYSGLCERLQESATQHVVVLSRLLVLVGRSFFVLLLLETMGVGHAVARLCGSIL